MRMVYPANGQVMMSHPRGVEMFSSGKVYSPRVQDYASKTERQVLQPTSGHELAPRFMTCISVDPTPSNVSVLQLSWSLVGRLDSNFQRLQAVGTKVSPVHITSFPI